MDLPCERVLFKTDLLVPDDAAPRRKRRQCRLKRKTAESPTDLGRVLTSPDVAQAIAAKLSQLMHFSIARASYTSSHCLVRHSLCLYAASSFILALCYLATPTAASDTAHPIFAEGKSDKEILDHLLKNSRYDKRLLPPVDDADFCCGMESPEMAKNLSIRATPGRVQNRVSYEQSAITYVWKNDEDTLRKSPSLTTLNAYLIQNQTIACPIKASWRGVTTMLNFFTTSNGFRSTLPVVSNLTAMNVWDGVCMCFIYASLLEFVCVNYVGRKRPLHNVVYRPGENPVTQEVIESEFMAAINAEKPEAATAKGGVTLAKSKALADDQDDIEMGESTYPTRRKISRTVPYETSINGNCDEESIDGSVSVAGFFFGFGPGQH
ncbi:Neurotransmitter-gated ion-channel ligand-binding domain [Sergentomyia squamirostris]